jgi:hypothetical protein
MLATVIGSEDGGAMSDQFRSQNYIRICLKFNFVIFWAYLKRKRGPFDLFVCRKYVFYSNICMDGDTIDNKPYDYIR